MKQKNNFIIIGYRGVGKSTLSKIIADKMDYQYVSTDELIENKIGVSIYDFMEKQNHSWDEFRQIETNILRENLIDIKNTVVDCGGGIVEREGNITLLKKLGIVFWLRAKIDTIKSNLVMDSTRPRLIKNGESDSFISNNIVLEIKKVLRQRNPYYQKMADYVIDIDKKKMLDIYNEIIKFHKIIFTS